MQGCFLPELCVPKEESKPPAAYWVQYSTRTATSSSPLLRRVLAILHARNYSDTTPFCYLNGHNVRVQSAGMLVQMMQTFRSDWFVEVLHVAKLENCCHRPPNPVRQYAFGGHPWVNCP